MAWTTPRTWTAGELVSASIMNTHVRDNLDALAAPLVTRTFNAANFFGSLSMTWTVASAQVDAWAIHGSILTYAFYISGTVGGTLNPALAITIPGSRTAQVASIAFPILTNDGTTQQWGSANIDSTSNVLTIYKDPSHVNNWLAGTAFVIGIVHIPVT